MKKYSKATQHNIIVSIIINFVIFVFANKSIVSTNNGWLINDEAISNLFIGVVLTGLVGVFLAYSLAIFSVKKSQDGWAAGIPIAILIFNLVITFLIIPLLDLRLRIYKKDFEEAAIFALKENSEALPSEYQYTSITRGVFLPGKRVFFMQSIGMMGEYGPGYLYDPSHTPEYVCWKYRKVFFVPNWYSCNLGCTVGNCIN